MESLAYSHDEVGNITQIANSVNGRTVVYDYDALYRLTSADSTTNSEDRTYTYDAVGNRLTETKNGTTYYYCYHPTNCSAGPTGNRLINIRTGSLTGPLYRQFTYDDAGRVTQKRDGSGSNLYTITYNSKGRASQINSTTFEYDPNDYRIRNGNQLHHLEGEHLEATYSPSGVLEKKYLRGSVIDEIVNGYFYDNFASNPNDFTNYTFHHDQINSVTALTGHNGTTEETTTYDPFGAPLTLTIPGSGNELLFTGREYDQGTGLYYFRARYYDPEAGGRFIQEDPIGFEGGINKYAYVNNNPITYNDPMGKALDIVADIGFIGYDIYSLYQNPGWDTAAALGLDVIGAVVPFATGLGQAYKAGSAGSDLVRAIPTQDFPTNTLGKPVDSEVFVTTASAIDGLHPHQIAEKLTIPNSNSFNIVQFPTSSVDSIKIPEASNKPGFIPGGYTQGRAPEFLVPNGPFPTGSTVSTVSNRTNGLGAAYNLSQDIGGLFGSDNAAGGGFVLYPSKPNTNMLQSVYSK